MKFSDIISTSDQARCAMARAEIAFTTAQIIPRWINRLVVMCRA